MSMLPLKVRILEYAFKQTKPFTAEDIARDLKEEYDGEKQFNIKRIKEYVQSFLGVKFFKEENVDYDENGELIITCSLTDYGKSRIKYIPPRNPMSTRLSSVEV